MRPSLNQIDRRGPRAVIREHDNSDATFADFVEQAYLLLNVRELSIQIQQQNVYRTAPKQVLEPPSVWLRDNTKISPQSWRKQRLKFHVL